MDVLFGSVTLEERQTEIAKRGIELESKAEGDHSMPSEKEANDSFSLRSATECVSSKSR